MNPSQPTSDASPPATGPLLLCFDGSRDASHAIRVAAELMVARNALVLSVWTPAAAITPLDPLGDMVGQLSGIYEEMDAAGAALAQRQAAEGVAIAQRAGFDAEPLTARGKPSSEIVRVAAEHDVASIILGARGVGALSAALLGSVAARIAQHCGQPVLIVPREVDQDEPPKK